MVNEYYDDDNEMCEDKLNCLRRAVHSPHSQYHLKASHTVTLSNNVKITWLRKLTSLQLL
jgi:hypothetical protein